jgi:DNA-directed RNA polymerase specialized sigma24 family protein
MQTLASNSNPPPAEAPGPVDIDRYIEAVLTAQEGAWHQLMAHVHPLAIRLCRYRLRGNESAAEDICRDVASKTLERLSKSNFAALRRYHDTRQNYAGLRFESWLRAVVGNVCVDHMRTLPGHHRTSSAGHRSHHIKSTESLSGDRAGPNNLQRHVEIRRVLSWLSDAAFPSDQRDALALWMRGHNAAEIATSLSLGSAADATRLLRAGRQRLRRKFEER